MTNSIHDYDRKQGRKRSNEDIIAVLSDVRDHSEYFVSFMDFFVYAGQSYAVMNNYETKGKNKESIGIVIMRTYKTETGEQYFASIRDRKELDKAFDVFYNRLDKLGQ